MEKNWLYKLTLEIATQSSYTWVKPMSKLWEFVYIESHVTLHPKADELTYFIIIFIN